MNRQTGRTTQQMLEAPKGAIFVWVNSRLFYPLRLAKHLGREDLVIKPASWFEPRNMVGARPVAVVIDHFALVPFESLSYLSQRGIPVHYYTEAVMTK